MPFLGMLKLVPTSVWKALCVLLIAFSLIQVGEHRVQREWDAEKAANKAHVEVVVEMQKQTTVAADSKQQLAEVKIQTVFKDRVIYKDIEVPHEVIVKEDSECVIPDRFVSMWNSANSGEIPNASSNANASSSGSRKP